MDPARAMLARNRLVEALAARWFEPLTTVVAPAGYGKTTLLTQAMAANAAAPLGIDRWLTCTPAQAVASSLGERLCQAVDARVPDRSLGAVVTAVREAIWRRSPQQVALVLDDVHEIPADSEACRLLAAVVASLPTNGHLLLAGRRLPPVGAASIGLDETDLAFTPDELAEFARLRGVPASTVAPCDGWPALAELLASAGSATTEYIGQVVLGRLPPARRRQLALLASLGEFDDGLARAVLGPDVDVTKVVAALPLVTRRADDVWVVHPLWTEWLAELATPLEVAEVRRRAGQVLAEGGWTDRAVRLFIAAGAWEDVTDTVALVLRTVAVVERDVLADWYDQLPDDGREALGGRMLDAVLTSERQPEEAVRRFEDCAEAFRRVGHTSGEVACLAQLGRLAWWLEQPTPLVQVGQRVFELEAEGSPDAEPLARMWRAILAHFVGDDRETLSELEQLGSGAESDVANWLRSIALLHRGRLAEAERAAEHASRSVRGVRSLFAERTRLQALWLQGSVAEATTALSDLVERLAASGPSEHLALVAADASTAHALQGDVEQARRYYTTAQAVVRTIHASSMADTELSIAAAATSVASGDEAAAAATMTAYVARRPAGLGLAALAQTSHLALLYLLVPACRGDWDRAELAPAFSIGRDLARALATVRERGRLPDEPPPLDEVGVIQAHLPTRWMAELGVAAVAGDRQDGWDLLARTWSRSRPVVCEIADRTRPNTALRRAAREALRGLAVVPAVRFELRLLGPVELWEDGNPVDAPEWRRARVRALLAYLAMHGRVSRIQLCDDLWPTLDADAQSRNLRVNLTYLRRVLEPTRQPGDASFFVRQRGGTLSLWPGESLTVDLWSFDDACEQAERADRDGSPASTLRHALRAVELWRGEPTGLLSAPWAIAPVERRRARFVSVAVRAGDLLLAQHQVEQAHTLAEQVLALDPWSDAAHRLLLAAHHTNGDRPAARRALDRYRQAVRELGVSPSEATAMVERLLVETLGRCELGNSPSQRARPPGQSHPGIHADRVEA